ncbi:MAG TPA: FAD:protein FMN transferase [Terriglobales bacterium]|nr:FAD:protein FMN transferase [Terriglobales bacterium]
MRIFSQSRNAMGTVFAIHLYAESEIQALSFFEGAFEEVERLEETLSKFRPSSEICRINRLAATQPVTTDPEIFSLIVESLRYSEQTCGSFDITVGPLMRTWGFFRSEGHFPDAGELSAARERTGFDKVLLDRGSRTIQFSVPEMELDVGAIGKGYAVDRTADILREAGVHAALVVAGSSSVYAVGAPPDEDGWKIHVPDPVDRTRKISTVKLRDQAISTSGSYERFFELDGRRYCHVMDPRTGMPVEGVLQSTLIGSEGAMTDAISNALFVLGAQGKELFSKFERISALSVLADGPRQSILKWNWPDAAVGRSEIINFEPSYGRAQAS